MKETHPKANHPKKPASITLYNKQGKTVMRIGSSNQPRRNSPAQFASRQRMRHAVALWHAVQKAGPLFAGGYSAYAQFMSLMSAMPPIYTPYSQASVLLPGMPISDGLLPTVQQSLGTVDNQPALITNISPTALKGSEVLRLYTLRQNIVEQVPMVSVEATDFTVADFAQGHTEAGLATMVHNDQLCLAGQCFANDMQGWALVLISGQRFSSQMVVSRSTYWQQFTTQQALAEAAAAYGGLTE